MSRPQRVVLVAGTGTEIGKTWVAAALLRAARERGLSVAARKPAQSFEPESTEPTDAAVLARAAGAEPESVCPPHRWYETAMAPPMAAAALGRPVPSIDELCGELAWPDQPVDLGIVEPAGGVRSPLASDGDTVTLADALDPDAVVLVADAGLGTINAVRLSASALGPRPLTVFLNRFVADDELHRANRAWLTDVDGFDVRVTIVDLGPFVFGP